MFKKAIVTLACVVIASVAFAQTRYYNTPTAMTVPERVIVTAPPIIEVQEGTVASYQPAGTLVVRTDSANPERFDSFGPGLVYDKIGRAIRGPIRPGARIAVFYASDGYSRLIDHIVVLD